MTVTLNDKTVLRQLREDMDKALESVGQKYGIVIKAGTAKYSYDGTNCEFKVAASAISATGVVIDKRANDFKNYCSLYNLVESDLNKKFMFNGKIFQISGLNANAPKFPIIGKNIVTGKGFKFRSDDVARGLTLYGLTHSK